VANAAVKQKVQTKAKAKARPKPKAPELRSRNPMMSTLSVADWRELSLDDTLSPAVDPVFGSRVDRCATGLKTSLSASG
jgi:hypothetical protein